MAPAKAKKRSGGFVTARDLLATPPGILGFSSLLEADAFQDGDKPKFKVKWHYTPEAFERLVAVASTACFTDKLTEELAKQMDGKVAPRVDMEAYLKEHAKQAGDSDRVKLPYLQIAATEMYKNRDGEEIHREIKAWDASNTLLDLKSIRLGMGSTVQIIVTPGLYCSKFSDNYAAPSFRLEGVRILKLVQFGAGQAKLGQISEEDKALMEEGVEPDDLSQYVRQPNKPTADHPPVMDDDEIPF